MILNIITPTHHKEVDISWLELNTEVGNFVIQPGHAPMMLILSPEEKMVYCKTTGKQETVIIKSGIVEIDRMKATVIIDG